MKAFRITVAATASAATLLLCAGGAHAQDEPLASVLSDLLPDVNPSVALACFPAGQVGQGNTFSGTQTITCSQSATASSQGGGTDSGREVVISDNNPVAAHDIAQAVVPCPAGKEAVSGGFLGFNPNVKPFRSFPQGGGYTAWIVAVENDGDVPSAFDAYAICENADS
ncbi:hypothetical protein [Streptomyces phaeofaciens]|uniref:hypothetical protein n=1 Tax=Streptomyces phaeofaciens TaxID=68254 RepID=UPI0036CC387F